MRSGAGAGMMLVKAAIEEAKRRSCSRIRLYSREHTRAFYEKAGFRYIGTFTAPSSEATGLASQL
jgi:predicted N-acetyltransferase YhbS